MKAFFPRPLLLLAALAFLLASAAAATDGPVNWPLPKIPDGANPATVPMPINGWMEQVQAHLDRTKAGPVDLLFLGDSITAGWYSTGSGVWKERYGARAAAAFGIPGDTVQNVLWRIENGELDGISPKLIVLMIGTNNPGTNTPAQVAEGIGVLVAEIARRAPSSHILLLGIFPRSSQPQDSVRARIAAINGIISGLDDGKRVAYLDIGPKFLETDGTLSKEVMFDFIHPAPKGYQIWADGIEPAVDRYLGPAPSAR